ncbi:MAG TPA: PEP-CTERM sorting domain-containing protein [Gemmataceae bacterium]|nr:PEP-CTERM sorting domain-containing protein [Gemmataceae bacterium]
MGYRAVRLQSLIANAAFAAALSFAAGSANATAITPGSGWIFDVADTLNTPTEQSPFTFTLLTSAVFSITDDFVVTDTYQLVDTNTSAVLLTTAPGVLPRNWANTFSDGDPAWDTSDYSKGQLLLGPGTYSIEVQDIQDAGLPAGLWVRLDNATPAPEPATLSLLGAGLAGFGVRRLRKRKN